MDPIDQECPNCGAINRVILDPKAIFEVMRANDGTHECYGYGYRCGGCKELTAMLWGAGSRDVINKITHNLSKKERL